MKRVIRYGLPTIVALLLDVRAFADPLDYDEAYVHRLMMPWMNNGDFGLLLVDYGFFALFLIMLGWLLYAKPTYWHRIENAIRYPFARINRMAHAHGGFDSKLGLLIYGINALLIFKTPSPSGYFSANGSSMRDLVRFTWRAWPWSLSFSFE